MCHTPRLNRFLAEFKRLTLEFGGEWEYGDGIPFPVISNPDAIGQFTSIASKSSSIEPSIG